MEGIEHGLGLHKGKSGGIADGWVHIAVFAKLKKIEDFG
jgi:hypothetical protein